MRTLVFLLLGFLVAPAFSACGGSDEESTASCAYAVSFDGRNYLGTGLRAGESGRPAAIEKLGAAQLKPCNDDGKNDVSRDPAEGLAYAMSGVSQRYAIAFGDDPETAMILVSSETKLPDDVRAEIYGSRQ